LGHSFDGESASDYSVCITAEVRGELCYVVDVLRDRFDYPDLRRTAIDHAIRHRAELVIIENKGSGIQLLQEFSRGERGMPRAIPFTPEHDKVTRMYSQCAKIEAGHVLLPSDAPWLPLFKSELLQFPHGKYDDQVDCFSQLLAWIGRQNEVRFEADFGYGDDAIKVVPAPVVTIKPTILVQRRVAGRLQLVRWDPEKGFCN
jgi:predicted phage terminase large subunit-like protein